MPARRAILYCDCAAAQMTPAGVRRAVRAGLADADADVLALPDLCGAAARRDPRLADLAARADVCVLACRPRAVRALLTAAGAPLADSAQLVDLNEASAAEALAAALGEAPPAEDAELPVERWADDWTPWFPVIDRGRCSDCGQCLNFCLFGVYARGDERVVVARPGACKTNCPACARVCPTSAIIFPKYDGPEDWIRGGQGAAEPSEVAEPAPRGADVLDALRQRNEANRRRQQADAERAACSCNDDLLRRLGLDDEAIAEIRSAARQSE